MKIGIDFDGVINTNNPAAMAVFENEIARHLGYEARDPNVIVSKDRYGFTDADHDVYQSLRHSRINSSQFFADMQMMPKADEAIKTFNDMGHQTYLVTARGRNSKGELDISARHHVRQTLGRWSLLDYGLLVDEKYSFADPTIEHFDKVAQCKNLGVTVLVDDDKRNIEKVRKANISAIHFGVETPDWQGVIARLTGSP